MQLKKISELNKLILFIATLAVFFKFWEPGIGLSSTTYGAFAANIVRGQSLFNFRLGPGVFDPFVDHPPLIIWIQALCFKLFGISAQILRVPSGILGIAAIFSSFFLAKKYFGEKAGVFTVLGLLLTNTFMNYTSSGWLDMGMIGFIMSGLACFEVFKENRSKLMLALSGLLFSCALLAKGLAAMGLLPIAIYILASRLKFIELLILAVTSLAPVALFDGLFFLEHQREFFSWYLQRREMNAAQMQRVYGEGSNKLWYLRDLMERSHIVFFAMFVGIFTAFKNRKSPASGLRLFTLLCVAEILIHSLIYGFTNKEYSHYLLPAFPWIAILGGAGCATLITRLEAIKIARGMYALCLGLFLLVTILPIKVHMGDDNEVRAMAASMKEFPEIKKVRVVEIPDDQHSWEGLTSYAAWYLDLVPTIHVAEKLLEGIQSDEAVLVSSSTKADTFPFLANEFQLCLTNQAYSLYMHKSVCTLERLQRRAPGDPVNSFSR